jgi:nucleoside-diphosphate-sugar epimerase
MPVSFPALLTGAGGFVGSALARRLHGHCALSLGAADWEARLEAAPLEGATVYHLAARVHDPGPRDAAAFDRDNVEKTRRLGEAAARRRARRLVFVSSIKVHGEESRGRAFSPRDEPSPEDPYGRSKAEAERVLAGIAAEHGLPLVVVRPPLVLGPGAKGNLRSLMALADGPWPLPFASIDNRRSFVHVEDLARLLVLCGSEVAAAGRTFIAAHAESTSTPRLVGALRRALGRSERFFPMPPRMLEAAAALAGQGERARRLTRSLEGDPADARARLGWSAEIGIDDAAREMAHAWRQGWR